MTDIDRLAKATMTYAAILAALPDPDAIGASEYRAIFDTLADAFEDADNEVADAPRDFALAMLREFEAWAKECAEILK